jgi:hypothetical protein
VTVPHSIRRRGRRSGRAMCKPSDVNRS